MVKIINFFKKKRNQYHPCSNKLYSWTNAQIRIEKCFDSKKFVRNTKDPLFLTLIGTSVHRINSFNSCLLVELIKLKNSFGSTPNNSKFDELINYAKFHNDLIVSKIKQFFFKEEPNLSENEQFLEPELEIFSLGNQLIKIVKELSQNSNFELKYKEAKRAFAKYFYFLGLNYDFIFDDRLHKGIFLEFSYDKQWFKRVSIIFENLLDKMDNIESMKINNDIFKYKAIEESLRSNFQTIILDVLESYTGRNTIKDRSLRRRYADFVHWYLNERDEKLGIEPFTWHLITLLWKADGYLQDAEEYNDNMLSESAIRFFVVCLKKLIDRSLSVYYSAYDTGKIDFEQIFIAETKFISNISEDKDTNKGDPNKRFPLIIIRNQEEVLSRLHNLIDLTDDNEFKPCFNRISVLNCHDSIKVIIPQLFSKDFPLKIEVLLEKLDIDSLEYLFSIFVDRIKYYYDGDNNYGIGILSSGVFLSHISNLYSNNLRKISWFFRLYPYIAIEPKHLHNPNETIDNLPFIIFDESIKTGFSISVLESYLECSMPQFQDKNINVYTLFDFVSYKKLPDLKSKFHSCAIMSNDSQFNFSTDFAMGNNKILSMRWEKPVDDNILEKAYSIMNDGRIDLCYVICNTPLVASISRKFSNEIIKKLNKYNKKRALLFSPSSEGRVLMFMTALFLKMDKFEIGLTKDSWRGRDENSLKVSIDLSENTGFTLKKELSYLLDVKLEDVDVRGKDPFFDLKLTAWPLENLNL